MRLPLLTDMVRPRNGLHRLRWILPPVIGVDTACTLIGQPPEFWRDSRRAVEGNDFFALFLEQGATFFLWTSLLYILGALLVASLLPRRPALIGLLAYVLGHYFGASSWLSYAFGFGMWVIVTYGLMIAVGLVLLGTDVRAAPQDAHRVGEA